MPTIRISEQTADAINELGGTFDKPDDVLQELIKDAGHSNLLTDSKPATTTTPTNSGEEGSRRDWISAWLNQLEQHVTAEGDRFKSVGGRGGADFKINDEYIGKVRTSKAWNRDDGRIWLRFEDEIDWADDPSQPDAVAVVLDIHDSAPTFGDDDHFFVLDQQMLKQETSAAGNRELAVHGPGSYEPPFDRYANDWNSWY